MRSKSKGRGSGFDFCLIFQRVFSGEEKRGGGFSGNGRKEGRRGEGKDEEDSLRGEEGMGMKRRGLKEGGGFEGDQGVKRKRERKERELGG